MTLQGFLNYHLQHKLLPADVFYHIRFLFYEFLLSHHPAEQPQLYPYDRSLGTLVEDAKFTILYKNKWQPLEEVPLETLESGTVWKIRAEAEGYKGEEFSLLIDWYQDALMISSELEKE